MTEATIEGLLEGFNADEEKSTRLNYPLTIWITEEDKALYDRLNKGRKFTKVARKMLQAVMRKAAQKVG